MQMSTLAALCLLVAFTLHCSVCEAAAIRPPSAEEDAIAGETALRDRGRETDYCPGYRPGSPLLASEIADCPTGADLGVVDHLHAFGINQSDEANINWTECGIPFLPEVNERVCYKTTIGQCEGDDYFIYLNQRNLQTLQESCPDETDEVPVTPTGVQFLQSPRYGCINSLNRPLRYRKSEFCLYHISMPECSSGRLVIDNQLFYTQEIEGRQRYHICTDYLQFFTEDFVSERYCDTELSRGSIEIPSTEFTALFWTDPSGNKSGFKLRVSCLTTL